MIFIKIIYFHIYNAYYKDGGFKNDIPSLTAYGIVAPSLSFIILTTTAVIYNQLTGARLPYKVCFVIVSIALLIFFFLFMYKKNYNKIYTEIKKSQWDNITMKIVTWAIVLIGFLSVGLYSYIFNRVTI